MTGKGHNLMLITNARLVTWDDDRGILSNHAVFIEAGKIAAILPPAEIVPL